MRLFKVHTKTRVLADIESFYKNNKNTKVIALAGNPNVGKSTVFNALTGLHQHTGNWTGKTVSSAAGFCKIDNNTYKLVDIPGTYSLIPHSAEEEVSRDFICFGSPDAVIVVCDATVLERNLNLVLQILEVTENVVVCVNLLDEARSKGVSVDLDKLSRILGVPVVGTVARDKKTLGNLLSAVGEVINGVPRIKLKPAVLYPNEIENAISIVSPAVSKLTDKIDSRWLSLKLIDGDNSLLLECEKKWGIDLIDNENIKNAVITANGYLKKCGLGGEKYKDKIVASIMQRAEEIASKTVTYKTYKYSDRDRKIDKILTGKFTAYPVMLLMLAAIFWITVAGANYPSELLSDLFSQGQKYLVKLLVFLKFPPFLKGLIADGIYKVLTWVISVMLPPMAIFFPLFTLLEDLGYLPRVAFNLDKPFKKCNACGKQALTMCMGLGCNAVGVVGCRIIDSPRERLLAVLTNSFVPCNGRFPAIISLITIFFIGAAGGLFSSVMSAILLLAVIVLGVFTTFAVTFLLSKTLLKGVPSSFVLELPSFRKPQIGKVLIRSILDRTLFVLGRAAVVAAPAGALIWIMANFRIDGISLLNLTADFLEPIGSFLGLDGVILLGFILGFPANEIVIPIIIMTYMASGNMVDITDLSLMRELFAANGWTAVTALCTVLFSLFHWPCSTTLMTVKKETGSIKWTLLAAVLPTVVGATLCIIVNLLSKIFM
jgi:ferrous iron transport protein B